MTEEIVKNEEIEAEAKDAMIDTNDEGEESFSVVFSGGALKKLKELASYLSISENDLGDVLMKGMKIIDAVKDSGEQTIVIESGDGKREIINVRDL